MERERGERREREGRNDDWPATVLVAGWGDRRRGPVPKVAGKVVALARNGGLHSRTPPPAGVEESGRLDFFQGHSRNRVAVVVTADGRRVTVPLRDLESRNVSLLDLLRSLLAGLESLGLLITGSRRENGGTRRNERH